MIEMALEMNLDCNGLEKEEDNVNGDDSGLGNSDEIGPENEDEGGIENEEKGPEVEKTSLASKMMIMALRMLRMA